MLIKNWKSGSISLATSFHIFLFSSRKLHENFQMPDKINSHIYLMLSVNKSFHQRVKYGHQINHI